MPWDQVMHKWKSGALHSGSSTGKVVRNRKQAIAIMLSEKRSSKPEYKSSISPGDKIRKKITNG